MNIHTKKKMLEDEKPLKGVNFLHQLQALIFLFNV